MYILLAAGYYPKESKIKGFALKSVLKSWVYMLIYEREVWEMLKENGVVLNSCR